jgi:hypothetical protein
MTAAVGFGLELRNPHLIRADSEVVKRFRGWPEFAARARASVRASCASIGTPPGCTPDDPFVYPASYQDAAELAYYAGWTRFGPAAERPSQLDLWNDLPRPGEPFVALVEGTDERRLFRGAGEGVPTPIRVELGDRVVHEASLTAWREWLGPVPRKGNVFFWLQDVPTGRPHGR